MLFITENCFNDYDNVIFYPNKKTTQCCFWAKNSFLLLWFSKSPDCVAENSLPTPSFCLVIWGFRCSCFEKILNLQQNSAFFSSIKLCKYLLRHWWHAVVTTQENKRLTVDWGRRSRTDLIVTITQAIPLIVRKLQIVLITALIFFKKIHYIWICIPVHDEKMVP